MRQVMIQPPTAPNTTNCNVLLSLHRPSEKRDGLCVSGIAINIPQGHSPASGRRDESAPLQLQGRFVTLFLTNAQRPNETFTLQQELLPARAVTRQNGGDGTAALCTLLGKTQSSRFIMESQARLGWN